MAALWLAACSPAPPPPAPPPPAAPGDAGTARVLQGIAHLEGTDWLLIDPRDGEAQSLGLAAAGAELLVVDDAAGAFYYRDGGLISMDSWRDPGAAATLVAPWPQAQGPIAEFWLAAESGELRAVELRGGAPDGAAATAAGAAAATAVLWGFAGGEWQELEQRSTTLGSGPGAAVFADRRQERGRSLAAIEAAAARREADGPQLVQSHDERELVSPVTLPGHVAVLTPATGARRDLPDARTRPVWVD